MSCSEYPTSLKYADIIPVLKKDDKSDKTNYRPIHAKSDIFIPKPDIPKVSV